MLPVSMTVGFIGYNLESWIKGHKDRSALSVKEKRDQRELDELNFDDCHNIDSISESKPSGTIFDKVRKQ